MDATFSILFVDDEIDILQALRRMLRQSGNKWECDFAGSGREALDKLAQRPFDLIVSDMRMPGMDGAALLSEVKKRHPETIRFILSGQTDDHAFLRSVGSVHQFLSKPCQLETLKISIDRAILLRRLLQNDDLKNLVMELKQIPPLPNTYFALAEELQSGHPDSGRVVEIVEGDLSLTAKILQIANSNYFGFSQKVSNVTRAVQILGLDMIHSLVLPHRIFSPCEEVDLEIDLMDNLWEHSVEVAEFALTIARYEKAGSDMENFSFTGGLFHEIGVIAMAYSKPGEYQKVLAIKNQENPGIIDAEQQIFRCNHAEVGAYLAYLWGFPDPVVESILYHHAPSRSLSRGACAVTFVYAANVVKHEMEDWASPCAGFPIDEKYLREIEILERLPEWRKICVNKLKEVPNDGRIHPDG